MSNALEKWFDKRMNLTPSREFTRLQDSFDRLFNELSSFRSLQGIDQAAQEFGFTPSCEITEEGNNYMMRVDLPGVTRDQVKVEIEGDQLMISAERKEEKKTEGRRKFLSEVNYGSYFRSFTLPGPVDEKKIDAKFENGVLTVAVPKTESAITKAKKIAIH